MRPAFDDSRLIRRIHPCRGGDIDMSRWPATVPAVGQILRDGLELASGVTVLAGENGAGKSTVVELIAEALGLNPQGGSSMARFRTRESEPGIGSRLTVERGIGGRSAWSYFLRADTMHGLGSRELTSATCWRTRRAEPGRARL
jgi:predicted ATPase